MQTSVDEENHCLNIMYQSFSPLLANTVKKSYGSVKNSDKIKEIHKLTVNFRPFKISH